MSAEEVAFIFGAGCFSAWVGLTQVTKPVTLPKFKFKKSALVGSPIAFRPIASPSRPKVARRWGFSFPAPALPKAQH